MSRLALPEQSSQRYLARTKRVFESICSSRALASGSGFIISVTVLRDVRGAYIKDVSTTMLLGLQRKSNHDVKNNEKGGDSICTLNVSIKFLQHRLQSWISVNPRRILLRLLLFDIRLTFRIRLGTTLCNIESTTYIGDWGLSRNENYVRNTISGNFDMIVYSCKQNSVSNERRREKCYTLFLSTLSFFLPLLDVGIRSSAVTGAGGGACSGIGAALTVVAFTK